MKRRYWEIDTLRGLAIIAMIIYHLFYNMVLTNLIHLDLYTGLWWIFPRIIAASFLTIMGISLTLSYSKSRNNIPSGSPFKRFALRGLTIIGAGMTITFVSWLLLKERIVLFGILHLIGLSIIISYPLLKFKYPNLILGILVLTAGLWLGQFKFPFYGLLWLGFRPSGYYPADYLPLLPWFSYVPLGIFLGNLLYPMGERKYRCIEAGEKIPVKILCFLGKHSLLIYLIHLPLLYGLCYLLASL